MSRTAAVDENDVLLATAVWLRRKKWNIRRISPASGQIKGEDYRIAIGRVLSNKIADQSRTISHTLESRIIANSGPDIIAQKDSVTWAIECKGPDPAGTRRQEDAIASSICEYGFDWYGIGSPVNRVGLALPRTPAWQEFARGWLSKELRKRLDVWILWSIPSERGFVAVAEAPG